MHNIVLFLLLRGRPFGCRVFWKFYLYGYPSLGMQKRILISFAISIVPLEYLITWFSLIGLCFAQKIITFVFTGLRLILSDLQF